MSIQYSQRQLRVGELLRHRIAEILSRGNIHDENLSKYSITVSQVMVSPDLRWGKVYVTFLGEEKSDQIINSLNNYAFKIQKQASLNLRLKRTPKLKFFLDKSFDIAANLNNSLTSISNLKRV